MAWIRTIPPSQASGPLKAIYEQALVRTGKVFQILQVQSLDPVVLQASMQLYMATTTSADSPLPRWFRELIAAAVSRENHCVY